MADPKNKQLTEEERKAVIDRLRAGESGAALAREFGISRQGIHYLKQRHDFLDGVSATPPGGPKRLPKMKLTEAQWEQVKQQLRESKPADHGLDRLGDDPRERWNLDRALQLAVALTGRKPGRSPMKAVLAEVLPPGPSWWEPKGPPVRLTFDTLSESQRADPDLAKYLLSDIYWQIQQREYAWMLRDYARRGLQLPEGSAPADDEDPEDDPLWTPDLSQIKLPPETPVGPGQRVGKHKGNRQQPPKPKRKKKKKKR